MLLLDPPVFHPLPLPARKVAGELGVDWSTLTGTGRDDRIREADVRRAASMSRDASPSQPIFVPLSSRRKIIAERMRASHARIVLVTLHTVTNAINLACLRRKLKTDGVEIVPAYTDIVACLVVQVLKRHRSLRKRWHADQVSRLLPGDDGLDIGIAP